MSSILDALKKLETEAVGEDPGKTPPGGAAPDHPLPTPEKSSRVGERSVLFFALGFLAAACVILLLFVRTPRQADPQVPETSVPAPRTPASESPPPVVDARKKTSARAMDAPGASTAAARAPVKPAAPSPARPKKETPPETDASPSKPADAPEPSVAEAPVAKSPAPEAVLKLQAIAWSDDPARRIAVINGRIVHEGGVVDGKTVDRIDKDVVVLRAGEKEWTLEFRREEESDP